MNQWNTVEILDIDVIAANTVCLTITRPTNFQFIAGQYVVIRVSLPGEDTVLRQYSFSSRPSYKHLQFVVRNQPGGKVSKWFCATATPGMNLEISNALGTFTIDRSRPALFIAGGVGITPLLSILREDARDIALVYSERSAESICYAEELRSRINAENLTIIESQTSGRIKPDQLQPHIKTSPIIYICGSFQFVASATKLALEAGVSSTQIVTEAFTLRQLPS